jgi:hypothetical protein
LMLARTNVDTRSSSAMMNSTKKQAMGCCQVADSSFIFYL